jgi:hypothetical protein
MVQQWMALGWAARTVEAAGAFAAVGNDHHGSLTTEQMREELASDTLCISTSIT